jgi:hypothetical protein
MCVSIFLCSYYFLLRKPNRSTSPVADVSLPLIDSFKLTQQHRLPSPFQLRIKTDPFSETQCLLEYPLRIEIFIIHTILI